jgi:DNA end-binding protein Ku
MRAIWNGHIRFSLVTIPVRLYSAIDTNETVSFNQLHKEDSGRVGYDKKCKKCGTSLAQQDIVKGYEYEPDKYVIIEQEDLNKVKIKSNKIIEIEGFVDSSEVHPTLYDTPYFIGPDGEVASQPYALLNKTLTESSKLAVGRIVIRDREDAVILSSLDNGIVMYKLRYPNEIRKMSEIPLTDGVTTNKEQLKLAKTLVDSMTTKLSEIDLSDRYQDAVKEMIKAKIEGKEIVTITEEVTPVVDMMKALKQSIEIAKKEKKPMQKAQGEEKKTKTATKNSKAKKRKSA